jgi:hypothetical protein
MVKRSSPRYDALRAMREEKVKKTKAPKKKKKTKRTSDTINQALSPRDRDTYPYLSSVHGWVEKPVRRKKK